MIITISNNLILSDKNRFITTLDNARESHWELEEPVTIGKKGFGVYFYFFIQNNYGALLSGQQESFNGIYIDINAAKIRAYCYVGNDIGELLQSHETLTHNTVYFCALEVDKDGAVSLSIDNTEVDNGTWILSGEENICFWGNRPNRAHISGAIFNCKLKKGGFEYKWKLQGSYDELQNKDTTSSPAMKLNNAQIGGSKFYVRKDFIYSESEAPKLFNNIINVQGEINRMIISSKV